MENKKLNNITENKILIVEDGSVDIDKLEEDGWYVIVYRQGTKPPIIREINKIIIPKNSN